jgi:hypothetical protein
VLTTFNAQTLPRDFKPLTTEEIGRSRRNILADPLRHRAELWRAAYGVDG